MFVELRFFSGTTLNLKSLLELIYLWKCYIYILPMFLFLWVISFGIKIIVTFFYAKNLIIHVISLSPKIRGFCCLLSFLKESRCYKDKTDSGNIFLSM